ncbi:hypothetical protein ASE73_04180 [Sphingomonas sp. Leaf24]|nr:hypothetical protein ASE50_03815 [Sphingomonas sp. Leaf5]KQM90737.1 hypothetical protein ASE73_04180 [Sphingomonas sp. Leaf24]
MQAAPLAGAAADAFAALFAAIVPAGGEDGRQAAADGGKPLPVTGVPTMPVIPTPVATTAIAAAPLIVPVSAVPVVAPVLPGSASEAIAMVPADPAPPVPTVRDAVPVIAAAGVLGALKLLPEDEPVAVRPPDPKPEQPIQPMPARFAPPLPVRARRAAEEPAGPTPDGDDADATEDGDVPVVLASADAPPIDQAPLDLPPMIATPADALAPVPDDAEQAMKRIGPTLPDTESAATTTAGAAPVAPQTTRAGPAIVGSDRAPASDCLAMPPPRRVPGGPAEASIVDQRPDVDGMKPVRTRATPAATAAMVTAPQDATTVGQPVVADGTPAPAARATLATGNRRIPDPQGAAPVDAHSTPTRRFAPVAPGALPGSPIVDPVRPDWQTEAPVANGFVPAAPRAAAAQAPLGAGQTAAPVAIGFAPIAPGDAAVQPQPDGGPIVIDVPSPTTEAVTPVAIPSPPLARTPGVPPADVAPQAAPIAAPRRTGPIAAARDTAPLASIADKPAAPMVDPTTPAPAAEPIGRAPVVDTAQRIPVADAATRPADPATVVIDQPAVPFTLPTGRAAVAQPIAEPLTPNRQTIAGEASAPVVSVAASTVQPAKAPPVTRVAAAPTPEAVAEVVLADAAPARPRRDDDTPPLPTPAAPAIDAATLRPVSAPVTAAQPHLDTRQPQWVEGMIDRIETLRDASPTQGETRIRLSPDALGDVEVAIHTTEDGRVHVHFSSENADAGRLLADAQPRLLQMAEARGLKLGGMQVDVGTQQQQSQRQAQDQGSQQPRAPRSAFAETPASSTRTDKRIA